MPRDERKVRERLEEWELRIQRVLALYDNEGSVPVDARPEVRAAYSALKVSLKAAVTAGDCWEGRAQMSSAERRFYYPAIQAASAHLVAGEDARPEAWHRSLCNALSAISDAVVFLEERERKAPPREYSA